MVTMSFLLMNTSIDWALLQQQARAASEQAYAPYSHFPVGVAIQAGSGKIYTGCNVENASYGGTICAERNAIAAAIVAGEREFQALVVFTPQERLTPPCGMCRQLQSSGANSAMVGWRITAKCLHAALSGAKYQS